MNLTIGMILLGAVVLAVLFGVGRRVLDKLRLTDKQALIWMALIIGLGFVPEIHLGNDIWVNLGGAVIPFLLCVYLWIRAGTAKERVRAIVCAAASGGALYALGRMLPEEPEAMFMEPNYLYGIAAGLIAYALGRSRRSAFIGGTMGMLFSQGINAYWVAQAGIEQKLVLGGAGAYDAVVIAGILAVLLAELAGEISERMVRGTKKPNRDVLRRGERT